MTGASQPPVLRKDQVRNRQRLITAAASVFLELGPDVALDEVARRAGMASSSLYRHFPSKEDLIECTMPEAEGDAFNKLAYSSGRTREHALSLLRNVVEPTTTRLRDAGGLREGLTVEDVAMFLRMAKVTDTPEQRRMALDVLLAGMLSTAPPRAK